MIKIVFTGPESTGKTTMAGLVASHYPSVLVNEAARKYIDGIKRAYTFEDLSTIARQQMQDEDAASQNKPQLLVCDTDLITVKIWSIYKYHKCATWILKEIQNRYYDMYFLCGTDINWQYDAQRENENNRDELYSLYKDELNLAKKNYIELSGSVDERFNILKKWVDEHIK